MRGLGSNSQTVLRKWPRNTSSQIWKIFHLQLTGLPHTPVIRWVQLIGESSEYENLRVFEMERAVHQRPRSVLSNLLIERNVSVPCYLRTRVMSNNSRADQGECSRNSGGSTLWFWRATPPLDLGQLQKRNQNVWYI